MAGKEYFINKLTFRDTERLIKDVCVYEYDGQNLSENGTMDRNWMVNKINAGYQISTMYPNPEKEENWKRGNTFKYENDRFTWGVGLPLNSTKHKTFVSYYHKDDQQYREKFERLFRDLVVSKSVDNGDIDSENSDEYIKQLIQSDYLKDTTVLVVLVGAKTKCRKHVDWEISGAISTRIGGNSGLIGILLPTHPDYGKGKYLSENLPERLAKNIETGYAKLYDWSVDRVEVQNWIEIAFNSRGETSKIINKGIPQMQKNTCE